MIDVVVVVQPAQAFRLDLYRLTRPAGVCFALITDPTGGTLDPAGRLAWIETAHDFGEEALARILRDRGATGAGVRLVTGMESVVRTCARVRERLGLPGPRETDIDRFLDKGEMKRRLAQEAPHVVSAWRRAPDPPDDGSALRLARDLVRTLGLPVFAKPLDGVGCDGVRRLDDTAALAAFLQMPRIRPYELDAFLAGPVFNADALIIAGEVRWFGACELMHPPAEVLAGATLASWTLSDENETWHALRELTDVAIAALRPPDGAIHLEAILTPSGFRFLEVACRNAGWLVPDAYEAAEGIDLRVAHLHAAAGVETDLTRTHARTAGYFGAIRTRAGEVVRRVDPPLDIPHRLVHRPGPGGQSPSSAILLADLLCEVVVWHEDPMVVRGALCALDGFEPYVLDSCELGETGAGDDSVTSSAQADGHTQPGAHGAANASSDSAPRLGFHPRS